MKNKSENYKKSFSGKGVFPYKYAFTLLIPFRNIFLSPKTLIERLELKNNMDVLEVGPGPGYFSSYVAKVINQGKLYLMDIQTEMLEYAQKRLNKKGLHNIEYKVCDGNEIDYASNSFDRIFLITVLGEIENKSLYLKEFYRILKLGGLLSFSELWGDADKLTIKDIEELLNDTEFKFYKKYGSDKNYTVIYKKYK